MPHRRRPKSAKLSPQPASSQPSSSHHRSSLPITDTTPNKLDEQRVATEKKEKRTQRMRENEELLIFFLQVCPIPSHPSLIKPNYSSRLRILYHCLCATCCTKHGNPFSRNLPPGTMNWEDFRAQHPDVVQFVHTHLTSDLSKAAVKTVCLTTHKWAAEDFAEDQFSPAEIRDDVRLILGPVRPKLEEIFPYVFDEPVYPDPPKLG